MPALLFQTRLIRLQLFLAASIDFPNSGELHGQGCHTYLTGMQKFWELTNQDIEAFSHHAATLHSLKLKENRDKEWESNFEQVERSLIAWLTKLINKNASKDWSEYSAQMEILSVRISVYINKLSVNRACVPRAAYHSLIQLLSDALDCLAANDPLNAGWGIDGGVGEHLDAFAKLMADVMFIAFLDRRIASLPLPYSILKHIPDCVDRHVDTPARLCNMLTLYSAELKTEYLSCISAEHLRTIMSAATEEQKQWLNANPSFATHVKALNGTPGLATSQRPKRA